MELKDDKEEIEFRGKCQITGEFKYGYLLKEENHTYIVVNDCWNIAGENFNFFVKYLVIPGTVGQYTGIKDKLGQKIFKDDILSSFYWGCNCLVIWKGGGFTLAEGDTTQNLEYNIYEANFDIEVIGNRFDNSDLLGNS